MAVHVRYNSWYISLPFSAKQQHEILRCLENVNVTNFLISNLSLCPRFSFVIVVKMTNKSNAFRVSRDS